MRQPEGPRVWTTGVKLMGNLLPFLAMLPFAVVGWLVRDPEAPWREPALYWYAAAPLAGWMGVNLMGLFANDWLKASIGRRLDRERVPMVEKRWFVGLARSGYSSLLDPHEDVGFLTVRESVLDYYGDGLKLTIPRARVVSVGRGRNPHSWIGLGGWTVLKLEGEGQQSLKIESRERATLWANKRSTREMQSELAAWLYPAKQDKADVERPRDEPGA